MIMKRWLFQTVATLLLLGLLLAGGAVMLIARSHAERAHAIPAPVIDEQAGAETTEVAVLAGGELLRIGAPAEVVTAETLAACYSVDVAVLPVADNQYRVCVPRAYLE